MVKFKIDYLKEYSMETEIKATYKDRTEIVELIQNLGFKFSKRKTIKDSYFVYKNAEFNNDNPFYRIRETEDNQCELTLKDSFQNDGEVWTKREIDVPIQKPELMTDILKTLECNLVKEKHTTKEYWSDGNITIEFIDIQKPAHLSYLEIESESKDMIHNLVEKLGDLIQIAGEEIFAVFDKK